MTVMTGSSLRNQQIFSPKAMSRLHGARHNYGLWAPQVRICRTLGRPEGLLSVQARDLTEDLTLPPVLAELEQVKIYIQEHCHLPITQVDLRRRIGFRLHRLQILCPGQSLSTSARNLFPKMVGLH